MFPLRGGPCRCARSPGASRPPLRGARRVRSVRGSVDSCRAEHVRPLSSPGAHPYLGRRSHYCHLRCASPVADTGLARGPTDGDRSTAAPDLPPASWQSPRLYATIPPTTLATSPFPAIPVVPVVPGRWSRRRSDRGGGALRPESPAVAAWHGWSARWSKAVPVGRMSPGRSAVRGCAGNNPLLVIPASTAWY